MSFEIAYVLALLVVALVLFAWDVLGVDVVGAIVLLLLTIPGVLTAEEALGGFGSETAVVIGSLFVITAGIVRTGVVERLGLRLAALGRGNPNRLVRFILIAATSVSSFLSNTVTTAVFLPLAIGSAQRARISASRILMPLAFATILSGGVSLIATSTNLVVSGELPRYGLERLGFFEMAPVGIPITILGMLYLLFVAPRLVPDRGGVDRLESYDLRKYFSEVIVTEGSPLAGKSLGESHLGSSLDLNVVGIVRGEKRILAPSPSTALEEGDILLIEGRADGILLVKDAVGVEIRAEFKLSDKALVSDRVRMVEAMVLPRSSLVGRTLREARFREKTGLAVLAIHSAGGPDILDKLSRRRLRSGDVLLLQGSVENVKRLRQDDLLPLEDVSSHHPRSPRGRLAAAIFVATVIAGITGVVALPIAFLAGAVAMIVARCITTEEAYKAIDWRLLVLIASMMAFGRAMEKTGAAEWVANVFLGVLAPFGENAILAGILLLTIALTQPMSNQAAALVVLPIAVRIANEINVSPRPLVVAVALAASCSFLTPLEPASVLVYGPGRYRFFDFVKVGGLLTVIVFVMAMALIPIVWPM